MAESMVAHLRQCLTSEHESAQHGLLVNGTERSSKKYRTFSARCKRASSRFFEASCFF